jgi:hypothetical protein
MICSGDVSYRSGLMTLKRRSIDKDEGGGILWSFKRRMNAAMISYCLSAEGRRR